MKNVSESKILLKKQSNIQNEQNQTAERQVIHKKDANYICKAR